MFCFLICFFIILFIVFSSVSVIKKKAFIIISLVAILLGSCVSVKSIKNDIPL